LAFRDSVGTQSITYYVVQDKLRSVRGLVKRDGTWIMSQRFGPYGNVVESTGSGLANRYSWTGREYDTETGWYYFRARYYDPNVRRFVQEDPIGYRGGYNLYAYASGDPLNRRDPWGTDDVTPECDTWSFVNGRFECHGGGGVMLNPVEVTGDAERDASLERAARQYVRWLMSTGQASRLATEPGLTRGMVTRILGMGDATRCSQHLAVMECSRIAGPLTQGQSNSFNLARQMEQSVHGLELGAAALAIPVERVLEAGLFLEGVAFAWPDGFAFQPGDVVSITTWNYYSFWENPDLSIAGLGSYRQAYCTVTRDASTIRC
jgi:RHS repeat-associated protein